MLQLDSTGKILNDAMFRTNTSADYIQRAAKVSALVKASVPTGAASLSVSLCITSGAEDDSNCVFYDAQVITLVDLAGHERYFKTTAYGLTGHLPDFACLIVGANAGTQLLAPFRIVLTKSMICCSSPALGPTLLFRPDSVLADPKMTMRSRHHRSCAGVVGMCKEHLGVALALKVPVFFVITKVR